MDHIIIDTNFRVACVGFLNRALLLLTLSIISPTYAEECKEFKVPQDILDCALKNDPDLSLSDAEIQMAKKLEPIAELRPNPEISNKSLTGLAPDSQFYTELNISHVVELGGKREARIHKARAEVALKEAEKSLGSDDVYRRTALSLYRIRQIKVELKVIEDVISTYGKIRKMFQARPVMTPEQKASIQNFEVSEYEYGMMKIPLESEIDKHWRELQNSTGRKFKLESELLPKLFKDWPNIDSPISETHSGSTRLLLGKATIANAQASLAESEAESGLDLRIGPSMEMDRQFDRNKLAFGFNVSVPLPLFHRNEAKTAYHRMAVDTAENAYRVALNASRNERALYVEKYRSQLAALKKLPTLAKISGKHDEIESSFIQGFINGSSVLDIHRQMYEYAKIQNEIELNMIDALLRIKALEGKHFEVK